MNPRISVVIPAYRCADTILSVIKYLRRQTLPCEEIIIVNDRSPDNLSEILEPLKGEIKLVVNERNLGLSKSYNRGIEKATGEYVMTLHSDCLLCPDYLEKLFGVISTDDRIAAVTGQYQFPPMADLTVSDQLFAIINRLPVKSVSHADTIEELAFIEGKADLFRRSDLLRYGCFSENLVLTAEDQDLSARFRHDGLALMQHQGATFTVAYNGTQDSIWKVLRKQRTYARGQAYVLLKYGSHATRITTKNRNLRMAHRISQLIFVGLFLSILVVSYWAPVLLFLLAALVGVRLGYYAMISAGFSSRSRLLAIGTGLVGDFLYVAGLVQGTILTLFLKKA